MHSDMIGESVPDPCFYDLNTQDTLPSKNVSKVRQRTTGAVRTTTAIISSSPSVLTLTLACFFFCNGS